ncbi:MAG: ribonuclease Y [Candidatus Blackburnbacteria bacterium RIFCSPHIGHO2_01_FULL_40_17]|uniref:Ribonuclease Y n=1 Tax=Candidatus Blackburnbacteria bacterium RIFCSPLOWO2_01_FULL_40_20 TaxID=1797519 RepID=A0A1G1VD50_9BACT|nr:MAG: ribonuclease Y [Candidatus Blackburnbacteria bacterium RIFCSPHIGHO2_01_FULL_40_17]OGY13315.1 MAG: ribonuclease Y [Candidatus Blackburnbacteria bacterium RIFCSPLOWO2_01_FULL_40_20]
MTHDEAKDALLAEVDKELVSEKAKRIRQMEENLKLESSEKAKEILVDAMRHGATDYVAEFTISTIRLPDEEIKGRVIGREGRNIRAFEQATGVEIEIDETNDIRLSSFDPIRREVARRSLETLVKDGRIQPSRIEEVVAQTQKQLDQFLLEEGKRISHSCGVYNLLLDLVTMIGRYRFRTSYGQNLAQHTIEETKIGVEIAHEVGADVEVVRLGCLLHDIGKVVTDEEGTHVKLGVDLLRKYNIDKRAVDTVAEHHEDKPFSSMESIVVYVADAISGSRPGARYEPHEDYVQRMEKIEEIANSFNGIDQAFAFQAGREVRVVVRPDEVSDDGLTVLVHDIAKKLENEAQYAGQIKVTAIRQTQASETTKAK